MAQQVQFVKLAGQGRAYDGTRPWTEEELAAWLLIQKERGLNQINAAEYVRQGVKTLDQFDEAQKKGIDPKDIADAKEKASKKEEAKVLDSLKKKPKKKAKK